MTAASDWETRLAQAERALRGGELGGAASLAAALSAERPEQAAPRYLLAVCARFQKDFPQAEKQLEELLSHSPDHARAYQELGHVRRDRGDSAAALRAYRRAVDLNPALLAAWKAVVSLTAEGGGADPQLHAQAGDQVASLAAMPRELLGVASKLHEGKLYLAEQHCRAFLQKNPHHPEGMRLLALLGQKLGVLDDAEFLLESCLELYPDFHRARLDYVQVLHRRQKYDRALEQARRLLEVNPGDPAFRAAYANESMALGHYEEALEAYRQLLPDAPDSAGIRLAMGHALKTRGDSDDAVAAYRAAYTQRPDFGDAFWSLANLKTYRFTGREVAQMRQWAEHADTANNDRFHLCFALGKALEDRGEFAESFQWYARGNALKHSELNYSAQRVSDEMQLQREVCDAELFARPDGQGCPAPDPIFIVGLPRAGSTLVEQILAAHSQVDGTFELPTMLAIAHRLGGRRRMNDAPRYPGVLAELDAAQLQQLGQRYLDDVKVYREEAPFFTDKMPNNFRHLGLVALSLPRAKIIDARRHPMACCFSGFKQLFAEGQEFSYDLADLGQYYRDYLALMDHWEAVLPGRIHRVQHELLLEDFEGEVGRLLDFCGLPFEESCLRFHRSRRSVRTASSEQVRQPLQRDGAAQWKNFEPFLGPLREALGDALQRFPG